VEPRAPLSPLPHPPWTRPKHPARCGVPMNHWSASCCGQLPARHGHHIRGPR
jgi:hypothetical protein